MFFFLNVNTCPLLSNLIPEIKNHLCIYGSEFHILSLSSKILFQHLHLNVWNCIKKKPYIFALHHKFALPCQCHYHPLSCLNQKSRSHLLLPLWTRKHQQVLLMLSLLHILNMVIHFHPFHHNCLNPSWDCCKILLTEILWQLALLYRVHPLSTQETEKMGYIIHFFKILQWLLKTHQTPPQVLQDHPWSNPIFLPSSPTSSPMAHSTTDWIPSSWCLADTKLASYAKP